MYLLENKRNSIPIEMKANVTVINSFLRAVISILLFILPLNNASIGNIKLLEINEVIFCCIVNSSLKVKDSCKKKI